jgi:hypothetical protein
LVMPAGGADSRDSDIEFHSPQASHLPRHERYFAPHAPHSNMTLDFAM